MTMANAPWPRAAEVFSMLQKAQADNRGDARISPLAKAIDAQGDQELDRRMKETDHG
jgi:hypothetical protein